MNSRPQPPRGTGPRYTCTSHPLATDSPASQMIDSPSKPARCPACDGPLGQPLFGAPDRLHGTPGHFEVARCATCGLGVTLPIVPPTEIAAYYPSNYSPYQLPRGILRLLSVVIQRLQELQTMHTAPLGQLSRLPPGRLLDVGCGRGDLGGWLVQRGWSVTGVEPSPEASEAARGRGIDVREGTLAEAGLEPGSYDVAVFRQSLEHVTDPVGDLRRVSAALREGGTVIVSVPNFDCWQARTFAGAWFHLDLPRHRLHFDADAMRATLARTGLSEVEIGTSSSPIGLPGSIQYALFGRCIFPGGLALRAAVAACALVAPLSWLADRIAGDGDVLHAVARKRVASR